MADLDAALADARRGHRITEWEGVAQRLAAAVEDHFITPEEEPTNDVEKMAYWAKRIIDNDGALSADSSADLDMAHLELTKAARHYVGVPVDQPSVQLIREQTLNGMQGEVISWAITKGWHGPDAPEVRFGEAMALLHSEVSEALEAFRLWGVEDMTGQTTIAVGSGTGSNFVTKPEGVGSEFADVLIRLLHYSELFGVDLAAEYERKMTYNHTRAFRHGGRAL